MDPVLFGMNGLIRLKGSIAQILDVLFTADSQLAKFHNSIFFAQRALFNAGSILGDFDFAMTATFDFLCAFTNWHGITSKKIMMK